MIEATVGEVSVGLCSLRKDLKRVLQPSSSDRV